MHKTFLVTLLLAAITFGGAGCIGSVPADAGVLRSRDGGRTFEFVNSLQDAGSLSQTNVNSLLLNPAKPEQILAATERGYYFSENEGDSWTNVVFSKGIGRKAIIHPRNEKIVFFTLDQEIYKSDDAGKSFRKVYVDQTNNITDLALDSANSERLIASSDSGNILISTDSGESWRTAAFLEGIPNQIVIDPKNPKNIFVATNTQGIYHSFDGGNAFVKVDLEAFLAKSSGVSHINDMSFNPFAINDIVAVTDYGMIRSVDNGKVWGLVDTLVVPDTVPLRSVAFHPSVANSLFFAAGSKLYVSLDSGRTWAVTDLATTREIQNIVVSPRDKNEIFLAVSGKGKRAQPVDFIRFGN